MILSLDVEILSSSAVPEERNFVGIKQSKDSSIMQEHEGRLVRVR
jgi:hypothetical protein